MEREFKKFDTEKPHISSGYSKTHNVELRSIQVFYCFSFRYNKEKGQYSINKL